MKHRRRPFLRRPKPTLGLALIVRDEQEALPALLASIEGGAFDQVVFVDTGSTDATVEVFRAWAERTGQRRSITTFEWRDDFAAARNYAQGLLRTDWVAWADADELIMGARRLRRLIARMPREVAGLTFDCDYLFDDSGECVHSFPRTRLVRRGHGTWTRPLHEFQAIDGPAVRCDRAWAYWRHQRNLDVLGYLERNADHRRRELKAALVDVAAKQHAFEEAVAELEAVA